MTENPAPCVLVCVTDQAQCENHIKAGRRLADELDLPLEVLNVQPIKNAFVPCSEELQYLFDIVKENDAGMTVYYNDEAPLIAAGHIRKCGAAIAVTGLPSEWSSGFVELVHILVPDVQINMLAKDGRTHILQAKINTKA